MSRRPLRVLDHRPLRVLATVWSLLLCAAAAPAHAGMSDGAVLGASLVVDRGPASERFNLVLLAEGFQVHELPAFAAAADRFAAHLFATPPFDEDAGINVWRVDVASVDSGADRYPTGCAGGIVTVRTYFDARFCSGGIPHLLTASTYAARTVLTALVPEWDAALVVVNTTEFGGSGGQVAVSSLTEGWEEVAVHELGHAAFNLADEYDCAAGGACRAPQGCALPSSGEPVEANVTRQVDPALLKWIDLVPPAVPLPMLLNPDCSLCTVPDTSWADGTVGLFEGARYHHCGLYRPEPSCKMRSLFTPFCAVCQRQIRQTLAPFAPTCQVAGCDDGDACTLDACVDDACRHTPIPGCCAAARTPPVVYRQGFEGPAGPEWSRRAVDVTPVGQRRFLGQFGAEETRLLLTDLPPHEALRVSFALYVIREWQGNRGDVCPVRGCAPGERCGPDRWTLRVGGGPTLVDTTFSNSKLRTRRQAYPDTIGEDRHPPRTGAAENDTLGYQFADEPRDAVYRLELSFAHTGPTVELVFGGSGLACALHLESWGLDDVEVVALVPRPPSCSGTP